MSQVPLYYSSTDASSPQLPGAVGSLTTLAHALFVTGYGSKAGLGWTREFNGTNVAVYRNNAIRGTGNFLRIDDSGSGAGGAREALLRIGRSATDVNTLVEPVPSAAQLTAGTVWPKSTAVSATNRPWRAWGTERWLLLMVDTNSNGVWTPYFIGDLAGWGAGDPRAFALFGTDLQTHINSQIASSLFDGQVQDGAPSVLGGWLLSNYANVPGGVRCQTVRVVPGQQVIGGGGSNIQYPHLVTGGPIWARIAVNEGPGAGLTRGWLPCMLAPLHNVPFADLVTIPNVQRWPGDASPASLMPASFRTNRRDTSFWDGQVCIDMTNSHY